MLIRGRGEPKEVALDVHVAVAVAVGVVVPVAESGAERQLHQWSLLAECSSTAESLAEKKTICDLRIEKRKRHLDVS